MKAFETLWEWERAIEKQLERAIEAEYQLFVNHLNNPKSRFLQELEIALDQAAKLEAGLVRYRTERAKLK